MEKKCENRPAVQVELNEEALEGASASDLSHVPSKLPAASHGFSALDHRRYGSALNRIVD